jgi:cytochrome P450
MDELVDKLIAERHELGGADNNDLLERMLTGVDRKSGVRLPDENIRAQCITFLVAGHETTNGLLSFAIYFLLKNPEVVKRAQQEVDRVLASTRRADVRAGAPADLCAADSRRGPAAVAHRAGIHPAALCGHRPRRPIRDSARNITDGLRFDAAPQ